MSEMKGVPIDLSVSEHARLAFAGRLYTRHREEKGGPTWGDLLGERDWYVAQGHSVVGPAPPETIRAIATVHTWLAVADEATAAFREESERHSWYVVLPQSNPREEETVMPLGAGPPTTLPSATLPAATVERITDAAIEAAGAAGLDRFSLDFAVEKTAEGWRVDWRVPEAWQPGVWRGLAMSYLFRRFAERDTPWIREARVEREASEESPLDAGGRQLAAEVRVEGSSFEERRDRVLGLPHPNTGSFVLSLPDGRVVATFTRLEVTLGDGFTDLGEALKTWAAAQTGAKP